ncbi:MAG: BNR-repeat neuraminidase N-terminal domain-containing protein [Bacteroidota bacterium]|nr:BNR-repeat neuraminidase N-terminal domain-containing protein [Bacteroidota bacterium]
MKKLSRINIFLYSIFLFIFNLNLLYANVTVTSASGGGSICSTSSVSLGDIVITEGANGDFAQTLAGKDIRLSCPAGYNFTAVGAPTFTASKNITSVTMTWNATTITINVKVAGVNKTDVLTIPGIKVIATSASPVAATGNIVRIATSNPCGDEPIAGIVLGVTNFGTLTQAATLGYSSSAVAQSNTANVGPGTSNNEIIGIPITISGMCGSSNLTSITLNTNGSTDPLTDITNAKIYYTGTSATFGTSTLFGTSASPNGSFIVSGNQTLVSGTNYFWLVYDVPSEATINDVLDGECTSVTVDGSNYTPNPTNVTGSRTIGISTITSNGTGGGLWNVAGTWSGGIIPAGINHVHVLAGDAITLNADAECINITIENGGSVTIGSFTFTVSGNLTINGTGNINTTCNSTIVINDYGGTKSQFVFPSGMDTIKKITMNRAAGAASVHNINLSDCVPPDSIVLVLTNGLLAMNNGSKLLLNNIAIQQDIPTTNSSYVDGIVSREVKSGAGMYTFPLGDGGHTRKFGIAQHSGADGIHEVEFHWTQPPNYDYVNTGFLPGWITNKFYWRHIRVSGGNPQRRIYYEDDDFPGLTAAQRISSLTLANTELKNSTDEWSKSTTGSTVYDNASPKYTQFDGANSSNNEYWTFGSTNGASNLVELPISLVEFKAILENNVVNIKWITASEINNDFFEVQRSSDGYDFKTISRLKGAGNSNQILMYKSVDENPLEGTSYYRLKQTDIDGKTKAFSPVVVENENNLSELSYDFFVNPNPAISKCVLSLSNLSLEDGKEAHFCLYDLTGKILLICNASFILNDYASSTIDVSQYNPGIYIIKASTKKHTISKRLVIKK